MRSEMAILWLFSFFMFANDVAMEMEMRIMSESSLATFGLVRYIIITFYTVYDCWLTVGLLINCWFIRSVIQVQLWHPV